jgi:hypothetical protein
MESQCSSTHAYLSATSSVLCPCMFIKATAHNHTLVTPFPLVTTPTPNNSVNISYITIQLPPSRKHPTKLPECLPLRCSLPRYQPNTIPRSQTTRPHQGTAPLGPLTSSSRIARNASHARVYVLKETSNCNKTFRYAVLRLKKGEKRKPQAGPPNVECPSSMSEK